MHVVPWCVAQSKQVFTNLAIGTAFYIYTVNGKLSCISCRSTSRSHFEYCHSNLPVSVSSYDDRTMLYASSYTPGMLKIFLLFTKVNVWVTMLEWVHLVLIQDSRFLQIQDFIFFSISSISTAWSTNLVSACYPAMTKGHTRKQYC